MAYTTFIRPSTVNGGVILSGTSGPRYFLCDAEGDKPTSGLVEGDKAWVIATHKLYMATGVTAWTDFSPGTAAPHTHPESDIVNLATDLSGKAPAGDGAAARTAHESAYSHALLHSNASDHTHSNKATLDTYTQTEANLADAVSLKHSNSLDHSNSNDHANSRVNGREVYAALANDTLAQDYATNSCTKLTVTANRTLTTTVPPAGCTAATIILTSGTASYTITFGSGFKPTATLATGTSSAKVFVINWRSDGTNMYEAGRTAAMTA
jgi:hypothetical protein